MGAGAEGQSLTLKQEQRQYPEKDTGTKIPTASLRDCSQPSPAGSLEQTPVHLLRTSSSLGSAPSMGSWKCNSKKGRGHLSSGTIGIKSRMAGRLSPPRLRLPLCSAWLRLPSLHGGRKVGHGCPSPSHLPTLPQGRSPDWLWRDEFSRGGKAPVLGKGSLGSCWCQANSRPGTHSQRVRGSCWGLGQTSSSGQAALI